MLYGTAHKGKNSFPPDYTFKPVLIGHSKKKTNYCLMQVKSIAECSKGSNLQSFQLSLIVIKIFVLSFSLNWLLKTGFTVFATYMFFLFCGVHRLAVR